MSEDRTGQILKLLNELIDLVKKNQPKVENHTHHHYPTSPTYYYPNQWTFGGGGTNFTSGGSGSSWVPPISPGSTTTWSTNDSPENGTDTPSE